jgi:hypothetical protein
MNRPVNATVTYRDQSVDLVLEPGNPIGRSQICPSSQTLSRRVFRVDASNSRRHPFTADVSIIYRYCRFEMLICNGQKGGVIDVEDEPRKFIFFMRKKELEKHVCPYGFRVIAFGRVEEDANGEKKVNWIPLSESECIQVVFNGVQSAAKEGGGTIDKMAADKPVPVEEPVPALDTPIRLGKKPLLWAKWRKWQAEHPGRIRCDPSRRRFLMAVMQALRDKMRRGEWFPKPKSECVEDTLENEEPWAEVSEQEMPLLEGKLAVEGSYRLMDTVIKRIANERVGVIPIASVLCAFNSAFNVPVAHHNQPEPTKIWASVGGINRANKSILNAISDVQDTMCNLKVLKRSSMEKGRPTTKEDVQKAQTHIQDSRLYIADRFKATFGSKIIQQGIPCFVRKDGLHMPPLAFRLHRCVEGIVAGFDPVTRATIITLGDVQERYLLPDPCVHFNREDAEMGRCH